MCFPGPRNIDPDIYDRLLENLVERVKGLCTKKHPKVGAAAVRRQVIAATERYMDEWLAHDEANEWDDWVQSNYPEYDPAQGGNQGESGNEADIREEFLYEKRQERLGWYYEDNGMGVIEKSAAESLLKRPKRSPRSAAGSLGTKGR